MLLKVFVVLNVLYWSWFNIECGKQWSWHLFACFVLNEVALSASLWLLVMHVYMILYSTPAWFWLFAEEI